MIRTAALLCIHNEANRLGWWIAHHVAAGFSALLVCDDHSTDGSQDILAQAARNYDIRLLATDQREPDRLQRQHDALTRMIRQEGQHFDWVIHLAVDEYFSPASGSVPAFFTEIQTRMGTEAFLQATHIPVSWCITGLGAWSQHPLDGQTPHPRAIFLTHASEKLPEHRITRDFFRPACQQTPPDPFAHIDTPPDWSSARILHDAASSSHTPQTRRHFDRNDLLFQKGQALIPQTLDVGAHLLQGLILGACYAIQNGQVTPPSATPTPVTKDHTFNRFHLHRGQDQLVLDKTSRTIGFRPAETVHTDDNLSPLCLIRLNDTDSKPTSCAWLHAEQPAPLPYLPAYAADSTYFATLLDCLPLHLEDDEGTDTVKLTLKPTGMALPDEAPLRLVSIDTPQSSRPDPMESALHHFTMHGFSAAGLHEAIKRSSWLSPSVIGALYAQLPVEDARTLFTPLLHQLFHHWKR